MHASLSDNIYVESTIDQSKLAEMFIFLTLVVLYPDMLINCW